MPLGSLCCNFPFFFHAKLVQHHKEHRKTNHRFYAQRVWKQEGRWSADSITFAYCATFPSAAQRNARHAAKNTISRHLSTQMANLHPTQATTSLTLQSELITGVRRKEYREQGILRTLDLSYALTLQEKENKQSITPFHLLTGLRTFLAIEGRGANTPRSYMQNTSNMQRKCMQVQIIYQPGLKWCWEHQKGQMRTAIKPATE